MSKHGSSTSTGLTTLLGDVASALRFQEELLLLGVNSEAALRFEAPPKLGDTPAAPKGDEHSAALTRKAPSTNIAKASPPDEVRDPPPRGDASVVTRLSDIRTDIGNCTRCKLHKGRTNIVFGVGSPQARLMFIGEAPGLHEDLQAEPFVGKAGQLLDKMVVAMGLQRRAVYIANITKCKPPRNRDPEPDEVAACEPFLKQQIECIQPEAIVALGRYAAQTLLRTSTPISRLRGRWHNYENIVLMPTFHPAYLLRNPGAKRAVWTDLKQVMSKLGLKGLS